MWQGAGEAFLYLDRFTLGGLVGAQRFQSNQLVRLARHDKTDFFDQLSLAYYPDDNLMLSVGHAFSFKKHAVTFQAEKLLTGLSGRGVATAVFAQGLVSEGGHGGAMAGVTFYFGASDKSLIRRHREDDPPNYPRDSLLSIVRSLPTPVNPQISDAVTQ